MRWPFNVSVQVALIEDLAAVGGAVLLMIAFAGICLRVVPA